MQLAYSPEIAALICTRIARGEGLDKICQSKGMPSVRLMYRWLALHSDCAEQYARAKENQIDLLIEELLEIGDDPMLDASDKRVRFDIRKYLVGRIKSQPQFQPQPPAQAQSNRVDFEIPRSIRDLSDAELERHPGASGEKSRKKPTGMTAPPPDWQSMVVSGPVQRGCATRWLQGARCSVPVGM